MIAINSAQSVRAGYVHLVSYDRIHHHHHYHHCQQQQQVSTGDEVKTDYRTGQKFKV